MRVLVLGAGGPAGSGFCRALRMSGADYTLIGANPNKYDLVAAPVDERVYGTNDLLDLVAITAPDFVHAQPEEEVLRLSHAREALGHLAYWLPAHDDILLAQDKLLTARILGELAPPVTNEGDLWIRPRRGAGGKGARRGRDELTWAKWMAQRYIEGSTHTWQSLYRNGDELWGLARDTLAWTHGDRGSSSIVRTSDSPAVAEVGREAIRRVANGVPHGLWSVDMLRDRDGRLWVTELNIGRFKTTVPEMMARLDQNIAHWYVQHRVPLAPAPSAGWLWIRQWDQPPLLIHERDFGREEGFPL